MANKHRITDHVHCECVIGLESDVEDLKRRLALRGENDPLDRMRGKIKRTGIRGGNDWMDELADQDASFFRRKLGIGK